MDTGVLTTHKSACNGRRRHTALTPLAVAPHGEAVNTREMTAVRVNRVSFD